MISVIIPVYNTEEYVSRCIDSVLNSGYRDFEVILVNDGSTDGSAQICRQYSAADGRVISIEQAHGGVSKARNRGIDESRGEWIVFVDSDDTIAADFLETVAREEYRDQELLLFDFERRSGRKGKRGRAASAEREPDVFHYGEKDREFLIQSLLNMSRLVKNGNTSLASSCAKAYRRAVLDRYSIRFAPDIIIGEDRLFNMEYLLHMRSCAYIVRKVYSVEVRPGSAMRGFQPDYLCNDLRYQEKLAEILSRSPVPAAVEEAYYNSVLTNMADVLVRGIFHPRSARTYGENRELCRRMGENEIYGRALAYNGRTGALPRRLLLCLYRRKWYWTAGLMCRLCYTILERTERL